MVVEDRGHQRAQRGHLRDDPRADPRVLLDDLALLGVQRARLEQDAFGDADGADVVQERRERQQPLLVRLDLQPPSHRLGEARDLRGVPVQPGILGSIASASMWRAPT